MSSISDVEIDLEKLFLPAWAQESPSANRYAKYAGEPAARDDRSREGGRRGPRREGRDRGGQAPPQRKFGRRPDSGGPGGNFGDRRKGSFRRDDRAERELREPPPPLPEITVTFLPDEKGVESIARQIKMTGRAFPLFQIAQIVLQKPERYGVQLAVKKNADGTAKQPLFVCALDDTPWLSEEDAIAHVLGKHFATFYQAERMAIEPPKGKYTFVAQCGMSGVILGPPNYHDYQNQLRKLHTERFSRMPFEVFKARIKIVRDEVVVKKWLEDQSFRTEYVCLNVPEPLKLTGREEVEKHFRTVHKDAIIKPAEAHVIGGVLSRNLRCRELQRLVRSEWERQKYFPLQLATVLSRQFATHGLQFFKVNRTYTHVSVARPQFLDLETTPVSEGIKRIIASINAHPKCTRRQLIEALAPSPAIIEIKPETAAPIATPPPQPAEGTGPAVAAAGEKSLKSVAPAAEPTPEQTAVIADLHWLIHQGHVIEFADGRMDTAKKPLPRPPKPERKPAGEKPAEGDIAAIAAVPAGEIPVLTEAEIPPSQPEPAAEPTSEAPATTEPDAEVSASAPAAAATTETPASAESAPEPPSGAPPDSAQIELTDSTAEGNPSPS